jgi:histone-lysine N-methyltransferase SETMAR
MIMTSVFWDSEKMIHVDLFPHDLTINAQFYSNLLRNDMHKAIRKKRHGKMSKIILLRDNSCPHMANLTKLTLATMGWEIMTHPPQSRDLVPSDCHLVGPMKIHLGGQNFQTDDELGCSALNWLHSHDKTFYATGSVTCQDDGKICKCKGIS